MSNTEIKQPGEPVETVEQPDGETDHNWRDEVFHILSNNRRRYTFQYLLQAGGEASKREVSRQVAARENGVAVEEVTADMRKCVYISLHQTHIPKMRDVGLLEEQSAGSELQLAEDIEEFRTYLDVPQGADTPGGKYYLSFALISGSVVGLQATGVGAFGAIPLLVVTAAIVSVLLAASIVHLLTERRHRDGGHEDKRGRASASRRWVDVTAIARWLRRKMPDNSGTETR